MKPKIKMLEGYTIDETMDVAIYTSRDGDELFTGHPLRYMRRK